MRKDNDLLGELMIPDHVYYGAQTLRALRLFEPSKETIDRFPSFIFSMGAIKKSCAIVNGELGILDQKRCHSIIQACDELMNGKFNDDLVLDMLSGNDFAPIHMNFNEVIACRANELITGEKGFGHVHPNTHVNMGLSTCDSTYTAARFALYMEINKVILSIEKLRREYLKKADEYRCCVKVSHTCFQDASPISIGQFYDASVYFLERQTEILRALQKESLEHSIGYTPIGTGLGSYKGFHERINTVLSNVMDVPVRFARNPFDDRQYADYFLRVSAAFKSTITGISKMARDIRIMSSGPYAGFSEITIAPVQNGSSFFPGKVNPSLAELINIACYQICGCDTSITMAVEAGELDCTPWYPVFTVNTLNAASYIYRTVNAFAEKCVATIVVNDEMNQAKAEKSLGLASVASALFGYKTATAVANYALEKNITIRDAVIEMKLMDEQQARKTFDPFMLTDVNQSSQLMSDSAVKERY